VSDGGGGCGGSGGDSGDSGDSGGGGNIGSSGSNGGDTEVAAARDRMNGINKPAGLMLRDPK